MSLGSGAKVLVVGGGIAGLSTAWALIRRGFRVELFDQGQIPNPRSASYDDHRITRHAHGEATGYARLMPQAFAAYERLFADIGARPFSPLPLVALMREPVAWFEESLASLDALGIAYRRLTVDDIARRYPMIQADGLTEAFEAEGAGILYPTRILIALAVHLASRGVRFYGMSRVSAIDLDKATLVSGDRTYGGDAVVIAAGAWVDRLVPELDGIAVPSRQAVIDLSPPMALAAFWAKAPIFLDLGSGGGTYTMPPRPGTRLAIGDQQVTRQGDPDGPRSASDADIARLLKAAALLYRDFDRYAVLAQKVGYCAMTADESFIVKALGPSAFVVSACSGHGFMLAPLIGEGVARAMAGEMSGAALTDWAAGRAFVLS